MANVFRCDLVIENARLLDGSLVDPAFVNGHMHLDKVYTLPMLGERGLAAYRSGTMGEAMTSIELASEVKRHYDRASSE